MSWDDGAEADTWGSGGGQVTSANDFDGGDGFGPSASNTGDNGGAAEGGAGGFSGGCFNCGEEGHMKSECTKPRVAREFTGQCNLCGETGHRKSECPAAPPKTCDNCLQEGHEIVQCTNPRARKNIWPEDKVPTVSAEEAWNELLAAVNDSELIEAKDAAHKYLKAVPDVTYPQLEKAFRQLGLGIYLIAIEKEIGPTSDLMDTQGDLKKKYCVTWHFSSKPGRGTNRDAWPESPEVNMERLADAGHVVDCLMPLCANCNQLGHTKKFCGEDAVENSARAAVVCFNCGKPGHRQRDCTEPRPDKFACKNCGGSGHNAKECTEPRNMNNVECNTCHEKGHFGHDCPTKPQTTCHNCGQVGHRKSDCTNERVDICRNCDGIGHLGKDCTKPKDWSRVMCNNCGERGHSKVKCPKPVEQDGGDGGVAITSDAGGHGGHGFADGEPEGNGFGNPVDYPASGGDDNNWGAGGGGSAGAGW